MLRLPWNGSPRRFSTPDLAGKRAFNLKGSLKIQVSLIHDFSQLHIENAWLAIGVFDGIHLGHRYMLNLLTEGARAAGVPAVVMTFEPHPAEVLGDQPNFQWLTPSQERVSMLEALGVEHIILQHFDREFAGVEAGEFMQSLSRQIGLRRLLVGYDFALGRDRRGNADFLEALGNEMGYGLVRVEPVRDGSGEIISSSRIRSLIRQGNVNQSASLLGGAYTLTGRVVHGDGRGHTINIPTANLELPADKLVPKNGVYACRAWLGNQEWLAVSNIGTRPTFTSGEQVSHVETHLLDFHQQVYGQEMRLEFVERLRDEQRFPSVEALVTQIQADISLARRLLIRPD